jgi:hypothetical protein
LAPDSRPPIGRPIGLAIGRGRPALRPALALALVAAAAAWLAPAGARAEVKRYAFLVGSNHGAAHETPLRYAESDVAAVADVLVALGGFPSERVVRLLAPTAPRVRKALMELALTIQRDLRGGGEAVLFAYYSGHADVQNLHLGGTELPTDELKDLVRLSQANLKVLLVDACRSGGITQVKGGRPAAAFQIGAQTELDAQLRNEGYAIITSSAAGEDSQESESLRGSVFTHHFLAGLRGLADLNSDRLVSLGEAYGYAREQTLKTSMNTLAGWQNATYQYDLRGRADPVLADLRRLGDRAELVLRTPGEYLLMDAASGALLFEAGVKTRGTPLHVSAGRYRVRARTRQNVYETELALAPGETRALDTADMRPVPVAQVVRKGETAALLASGPTVGASVHGGLAEGFSPMMGVQIGWAFELPRFSLIPRLGLGAGRATAPAGGSSHTLRELTAELVGLYVVDVGRLALAPSLSVGWVGLQQRVEAAAGCQAMCTQTARPHGLVTTVGGWAAYPLGGGFTLEASLELANFYVRRQVSTTEIQVTAPRVGTVTYRTGLGLGYRY